MGIPFGPYQLLKRIAAGGMGEVFLARQQGMEGFEKLLVVKVLMPHLVENREFVTMFFDEARIAARLNHPNIGQIYDLGEHEGNFFIAMEYIHGEDVLRLFKAAREQRKPVPLALSVRIASDAAAGLDYAHKAKDANGSPLGIVHRDVSPQNLLVTYEGGVKLIDFGVAKAAGRGSHTATGTLKGKYPYMSPEQIAGEAVDKRSDIFALGVVLYEMATSRRLFKRDTEVSTLKAVEACQVPTPSTVNPDIDPQLEAVMLKALARSPAKRFSDAAALRLALEDWLVQKRLPGSSAHLAQYLQDLGAERLAEERAEGRPFTDFEGTPSAIFHRSALATNDKTHLDSPPGVDQPAAPEPEPASRQVKLWAAFWVGLAVAFGLALSPFIGKDATLDYFTAYLLEKAFSVDHLFFFAALFGFLGISQEHQRRVLAWGLVGALLVRGVFLLAGVTLLHLSRPLQYLVGAAVLVTALRLYRGGGKPLEPGKGRAYGFLNRRLHASDETGQGQFFAAEGERMRPTQLMLALLVIFATDLVFAAESIPAVLAVTPNPFVVYSSNILAVLGLRALHFLLAGRIPRLRYLRTGLALSLTFLALKMVAGIWIEAPASLSLKVVGGLLALSVAASLWADAKLRKAGKTTPA
jgi:TerC family integral membrane protein